MQKEEKILGKQNRKKVRNSENKQESLLVTKESLCATFATFSFLAFLIVCTGPYIFGDLGLSIYSFFAGIFGYLIYPLLLCLGYLSVTGLLEKRLVRNRKAATAIVLTLIFASLIVHTALTFNWPRENYLTACLSASDAFPNATVAGWFGGLIVFGVSAVMSNVGAIVLFSSFALFFAYFAYINVKVARLKAKDTTITKEKKEQKVMQTAVEPQTIQNEQPQKMPAPQFGQEHYTGYSPLSPVSAQSAMPTAAPVTIEKAAASNVYSPFGRMENMNTEPEVPQNPQTSREILFGGDPIENFKKNGMFDPNSKANNRPMDPVVPMTPPTNTGFVPSYTKAYEEDFNEEKPAYRSVTSFTSAQEPMPKETIEPLPYMEETPSYQEPIAPIVETPILETPREEYLDFGRETEKETPSITVALSALRVN